MMASSKQIPHDLHEAASVSDWLVFLFQYGTNESDSQRGEGKGLTGQNKGRGT